MLKTRMGTDAWLVHQPDHARVAGYLAAHWGGGNGFARPGYFAPSAHPEVVRQEVVLAIAEHDNGWWEWEASPAIDPADDLPLGLADVGRQQSGEGFQRWRLGVPRLAATHPYVALLISKHAHALYAFAFEDEAGLDDAFRHPLFGGVGQARNLISDEQRAREFLDDQRETQQRLLAELRTDAFWAEAANPAHLDPHFRLLQVMDALSLMLSFGGRREHVLHDIPRRDWDDRLTLAWRPVENRRIVCDPFPFDTDPLHVHLPVRIVPDEPRGRSEGGEPLTRLHAAPLHTVTFELVSRA
jgi:hypothetical protein